MRMPTAALRVSCSTACLYHLPLRMALRLIRAAGFDNVEMVASVESLARGFAATRRMIQAAGLRALSYHPPLVRVPNWPRDQFRMGMAIAEGAQALGCEVAVIHAPQSTTLETPRGRQYIAALHAARRMGEDAGFAIGLETTERPHQGKPLKLFDDLEYLLRFTDDLGLGVTLDTTHAAANGDDLATVTSAIGPRLRNIHFSDCRAVAPDRRPLRHLIPGQGNTVDLAAFVRDLSACGYSGIITCEISPLALHPFSPRRIVQDLTAAREFIERSDLYRYRSDR
jgi:sugar phosphate isomerase/epimerase